jgi:hypothetical protein
MALKPPSPGMTAKIGAQTQADAIPILYKAELEEHRRLPQVQARLRRVQALIESRRLSKRSD